MGNWLVLVVKIDHKIHVLVHVHENNNLELSVRTYLVRTVIVYLETLPGVLLTEHGVAGSVAQHEASVA